MRIKSKFIFPYAKYIHNKVKSDAKNALEDQRRWLKYLITNGGKTKFGKDHDFHLIHSHKSFTQQVPVREYEDLKSYINQILAGDQDILWSGKPKYLAKTSGTTSGVKYIPISNESIPYHLNTARNAVLNHSYKYKNLGVFDGYLMFLSGSPILEDKASIPTGRLSGIVNHEIPLWLKGNQKPSYAINCIEDWEEKLTKVIEETSQLNMTSISGIPPWVQMYFEKLLAYTGKENVAEVFPEFSLFVYGGVNYEPYKNSLETLMGKSIQSLETYPASEGFIAFQDESTEEGLLLNTNAGIFYEFVPLEEIYNPSPTRLTIADVELAKDYGIILTSNAGLWAYNIGDTVRFVSRDPYRIIVTGRIKHFISAFGEHVIAKEVDTAIQAASKELDIQVVEYTVAPQVNTENEAPYHEWFIEFKNDINKNLNALEKHLDNSLQDQNIYYRDLREGNILQKLKVKQVVKEGFRSYMASIGKLGGQNKVPRLSNDRAIVDLLKTKN